jgi:hypothetical protein
MTDHIDMNGIIMLAKRMGAEMPRATIYRRIAAGVFPRPVEKRGQKQLWSKPEVVKWLGFYQWHSFFPDEREWRKWVRDRLRADIATLRKAQAEY